MEEFLKIFKDSYIQTFDDSGAGRRELVSIFPMKYYEQKQKSLEAMNSGGAGIFFTSNPCNGGRKEENVTSIKWVYIDMDNGTKAEMQSKIKDAPIKPHIIIESSRSYHLYWRVDCSREGFDTIIGGLLEFFDGDPAISSINEVLRFPGYLHMKDPKNPFMVKVIFQQVPEQPILANKMIIGYHATQKPVEALKTPKKVPSVDIYSDIRSIPILKVLESLDIEVKKNFIWEDDKITSASINVKGNYINRFSGREGSGSTIDACVHYGKMTLEEAVKYLSDMFDAEKIIAQAVGVDPIDQAGKPFTWGTPELDRKISPLQNDSFVIFAGETGSGKTAWSFDCALKNADLGHKVLYLSLEMNTEAIFTRIARDYAGINKEQWRDKSLIDINQIRVYKRRKAELRAKENLTAVGFLSGVFPTMEKITAVIKSVRADMVFLDNFDLIIKNSDWSQTDSENKTIQAILNLCKMTPMPMVVMHHLKKGEDKDLLKPRAMTSVRGSAKIVDGADIVLLGFRQQFSEGMTTEDKSKYTIIQLKDRDFGVGGYHTSYFNKGTFVDTRPMSTNERNVQLAKQAFDI